MFFLMRDRAIVSPCILRNNTPPSFVWVAFLSAYPPTILGNHHVQPSRVDAP